MNKRKRPWHDFYEILSGSAEVRMLQLLEPAEFSADDEWAINLRQQFPTVPPAGIEMCHKNWLVGLDMILDSIAAEKYQRENYWCGNIPLETISGLGLRRRVLQFWLKNVPQQEVTELFTNTTGDSPFITALYYRILGENKDASFEVKADVQNIVDLLVGPFINGQEAISAKWQTIKTQQKRRSSILEKLDESVITCLCNFRTLVNIDSLIKMIAQQKLRKELIGGCNTSLQFIMQEAPEVFLASEAIVWASYIFVASELGQIVTNYSDKPADQLENTHTRGIKLLTPPEIIKDQVLSIIDKLGNSTPLKRWLVASLGLLVKAWLKRAWAFIGVKVESSTLPNFVFQIPDSLFKKANKKARKAPKVNTVGLKAIPLDPIAEHDCKKISPAPLPQTTFANSAQPDLSTENKTTANDETFQETPAFLSLAELDKLVENEEINPTEDTISGRMTACWSKEAMEKRIESAQQQKNCISENNRENTNADDVTVDVAKAHILAPEPDSLTNSKTVNPKTDEITTNSTLTEKTPISKADKPTTESELIADARKNPIETLDELNLSDENHVFTEIMNISNLSKPVPIVKSDGPEQVDSIKSDEIIAENPPIANITIESNDHESETPDKQNFDDGKASEAKAEHEDLNNIVNPETPADN